MNALEEQLSYPFQESLPALGESIQVAPGVRWLRMNLPFALNHINLWLLRDCIDGREGWTVVDCGVASDETREAWLKVFETQLDGLPVLRVMATHMHPDHIGLAHWITERWHTAEAECRFWISAPDFLFAKIALAGGFMLGGASSIAFFASHGLPDEGASENASSKGNQFSSLVAGLPSRYRRLLHGMRVPIGGREWVAHAGYGHAPEHIALHCPEIDVLISGDMVLPRISTNISVLDQEPESNALQLFLDSIEAMRALPADTLVLPAHGRPFRGLHTRIDQLQEHHADRLREVLEACTGQARTAADMLMVLFKRKLDFHQTTFAMGEAIAHLNMLWLSNRMTREYGADGVYRFRTV